MWNQATTLHWLSPSDPGLTPYKPVKVREYRNVIRQNLSQRWRLFNMDSLLSQEDLDEIESVAADFEQKYVKFTTDRTEVSI